MSSTGHDSCRPQDKICCPQESCGETPSLWVYPVEINLYPVRVSILVLSCGVYMYCGVCPVDDIMISCGPLIMSCGLSVTCPVENTFILFILWTTYPVDHCCPQDKQTLSTVHVSCGGHPVGRLSFTDVT